MVTLGLTISSGVIQTERHKPTKEHLAALYDLINELLPQADVYYTPEQLEELPTMKGIDLI